MTDDDSNTSATASGPLNRRAVLAIGGAATATAALVVTGCSTYSPQSAPEPSAPGAGGASGAGESVPELGPVTSVPVGGGRVFPNQQVVVTQPTTGTFKAFSAVCTHAGCTVGSVSGGTINCPCHGSKFNITDGSVVSGPAKRALATMQVDADRGTLRLT